MGFEQGGLGKGSDPSLPFPPCPLVPQGGRPKVGTTRRGGDFPPQGGIETFGAYISQVRGSADGVMNSFSASLSRTARRGAPDWALNKGATPPCISPKSEEALIASWTHSVLPYHERRAEASLITCVRSVRSCSRPDPAQM